MCERAKHVKIQWIEFENLKTGLKIERVNFNSDVTLLVGLSGVGKTQILKAVEYSLNLAVDKDVILRPYRVGLGILINNKKYEWFYEITKINEDELIIKEESKYEFLFEKLICNGTIIFERKNEKITVIGYDKVPQPKKDESLISQYSEDKNLELLVSGIHKLYSVEIEVAVRGGIVSESFNQLKSKVTETFKRNKNVEFKIFSHLPVAIKLYIAKRYYPELYIKIFDAVKELFIEVEDIRSDNISSDNMSIQFTPNPFSNSSINTNESLDIVKSSTI